MQNENKTEHKLKWPYILDHSYKLIIGCALDQEKQMHYIIKFNKQSDINEVYL